MNKSALSSEFPEVEITDLAVGGKGVGRINGKVVFVEKSVPGQLVKVQVFKERKDYCEARISEVLKKVSMQREPRCGHFPDCGGCAIQNINYSDQLRLKKGWVQDSIQRIAGIDDCPVRDTVPSPDEFFYRNKMEFSFGNKVWDPRLKKINGSGFDLGLHLPGRFDTVMPVHACYLQSEASNRIVEEVRKRTRESGLPAYNIQRHTGFWRILVIREGKLTGSILINLITNKCGSRERKVVDKVVHALHTVVPEISSIYHSEHPGKSHASVWETIRKVHGKENISEKIGNYSFTIDCETFFQTNSKQVENLYEIVKQEGEFSGNEIVYDLFAGSGAISIFISESVRKVIGFELNSASVTAAHENFRRNNISNCHFIQGKIRSLLKYPPPLFKKYGRPDVVIIDPPRSGMDMKTSERVNNLGAPRIIYVSCNPSTLARDLKFLNGGYSIKQVVPVDMFPQTPHVESVTTLVKRGSN